jgi:low affinity Fe/Cu permease
MKSTAIPGMTGRHSIFDRFAGAVTRLAGTPWAFAVAVLSIVVWSATGPLFHFSGSWQMVVNTGTTIVTFLMVFLIQQSQNKDSLAVHIKLNELLAANELASNRVVAVEDLDEADLETLRKFYCEIALLAEKEGGVKCSHSLDDAQVAHARKHHDRADAPKKSARRTATTERT